MSQSSLIVAALLAGFVLYLAAKGRLTTYTGVLWGQTAAPLPGGSSTSSGVGSLLGQIGSAGATTSLLSIGKDFIGF